MSVLTPCFLDGLETGVELCLRAVQEVKKEFMPLALAVYENDVCKFVGPHIEKFLDHNESVFLGKSPEHALSVATSPNIQSIVLERLKLRAQGKDVPEYYEIEGVKKDGTTKSLHILSKIFDVNQAQLRIIVIFEPERFSEEMKYFLGLVKEAKYRMVKSSLGVIS